MTTDKQIISIDEKSVSITLFIPLCPKASETKRKNPQIIDNKAVEIIDKLNFDTKPYLQKRAYHSAIVRTHLIDNGVKGICLGTSERNFKSIPFYEKNGYKVLQIIEGNFPFWPDTDNIKSFIYGKQFY